MDKYTRLEQVKEQIRHEPQKLDMNSWRCGTSMCIAGWLTELSGQHMAAGDTPGHFAARLLGYGSCLFGPAGDLFFVDDWPEVFQVMFAVAKTADEKAEVACDVIDDWMVREKTRELATV